MSDYEEILINEDIDWNAAKVPRNFVIGEDDRGTRASAAACSSGRASRRTGPLAKSREGAFSQFLVELERYGGGIWERGRATNINEGGLPAGHARRGRAVAGPISVGEMKEERRRRLDGGFVWKKQKGGRDMLA